MTITRNRSSGPFIRLGAKITRNLVKSSECNEQPQSGFFKTLPLDIRNVIFKQVVADLGNDLHSTTSYKLQAKERNLIYQRCIATTEDYVTFKSGASSWGETHTRCKESAKLKLETGSQSRSFMPLLLSYKRIHAEATTVIYCTVTFRLVGTTSSSRFLSLDPLVQLSLIRSLHLSWMIDVALYTSEFHFEPERGPEKTQMEKYKEAKQQAKGRESILRMVANMHNLRELQVTIYDFTYRVSEKDLLQPLTAIKGVENFMVKLPWALEYANNPLEETLFEIGNLYLGRRVLLESR